MTVFEILVDVTEKLESVGIRYAVGGSLASSAWGQMRQTNDADIAILAGEKDIESLSSAFIDPYSISRSELTEAFENSADFRAVQVFHMEDAFKIDLFLLPETEYSISELDRARRIELTPGTHVSFCAPENIVLAKLRWFELGHRVSDRQWNDIVQVLEVQGVKLDIDYLERWAGHFRVDQLLTQAQHQATSI